MNDLAKRHLSPARPPIAGSLAVLLVAMVSIQIGASLAKGLFPAVGAQGATALRLAFSALVMTLVGKPWRVRLTRTNLTPLLLYGLSLGVMNLCFYMALRTVPLGVAVALEFLGPLGVAVATSRKARDFVWVALAATGVVVLSPVSPFNASLDVAGAAFALSAGGCWALYIVFGAKAGEQHGGRTVAVGSLVAAAVAVPFGVAHAGLRLLDPALLPLGIGVAILSSALPYSLEMIALRRLPARTFGICMSAEPALAALSGFVFLDEHLGPAQLLGVSAIIAASIGAVFTARTVMDHPDQTP